MSAVKILAWSAAAWTALSMVSAQADAISGWPWTGSLNSYQATSAATTQPTSPAAVTPIFAATSDGPTTSAPTATMAFSAPATPGPIVASPAAAPSGAPVDAFINLTSTSYPEEGTLTTGNPQPWYDSPSVVQAFGHLPSSQEQSSFVQAVLQDVQHTFQLSGMNPTLTTDPNVPALHTISVVSGATYGPNPDAIGITDVGGNGFGFIDKLHYASNPTDLAWAVAHNVSHELMHAFGIGYHPDGGNAVDAASANWSSLIDPNMQFGPGATQLLLASQYGTLSNSTTAPGLGAQALNPDGTKVDGDMELLAVPAPEPATMAMWALGVLGGLTAIRRRQGRTAA